MKLSIIVPVYNGQDCILRCLKSIVNQTCRDFEIIVVNDGSTDNTQKVIETFKKDVIIPFTLINQKNMGNSLARKSGIKIAIGEYLGFVDADDWIEPQYFASLLNTAISTNADMVCSEVTEDFGIKQKILANDTNKTILTDKEAVRLLHQRKAIYPFLCNKIIKRMYFEKIIFPEKNMIGEDYTLVAQILCRSNTIALSSEKGYHYIILNESVSHTGYNDSFKHALYVYPKLEKYMIHMYPESKTDIQNFMIQNYMGAIMAMCKNKKYDYSEISKIQRYIRAHLKGFIKYSSFSLFWKSGVVIFSINDKLFRMLFRLVR